MRRFLCKGEPPVIVRNLQIEEVREMAEDPHAEIQRYKDTISCADNQQWRVEVVQNLESDELEWYPCVMVTTIMPSKGGGIHSPIIRYWYTDCGRTQVKKPI